MTFRLFPMIHIGSPEFYEAVRAQVAACDVAVMEGIAGKSMPGSWLTMSYRVARFSRRSRLVVQDLHPDSFDIPVIRPDMTGPEFDRRWRRVPWRDRALLGCLVPAAAAAMLVVGPEEIVKRHSATEDEPSLGDLQNAELMPEFEDLVLDQRDQLLIKALTELHEQRCQEPITVAVVYGAGHIGAVVHALSSMYRYVARDGEYLTVC